LDEVAVILPCYNAANFLTRALDSVLAQTHQNCRVWVVDDGSTDETAQVVKRYPTNVEYFCQEHAGQSAARNRGIDLSGGTYIAFLDADDYWFPEKLQQQIAVLEKSPNVGLVCTDCATLKEGRDAGRYFGNGKIPKTGRLFERLTRECFVFTPTVVIRRKCLEEIGRFNQSLVVSEDFHLWLRIAARWDVAVIPELLAVREILREGLSLSTHPEIYLQNGIAALEDVRAHCTGLSSRETSALRKAIMERYYVYGSYLLENGEIEESRAKLAKALRGHPTHWRAWAKLGLSVLPSGIFRKIVESRRRFP
jgi:glycosyltransferase involved in cell wall biosynthesis